MTHHTTCSTFLMCYPAKHTHYTRAWTNILSILGNEIWKLYDINLKKSKKAADIPKYLRLFLNNPAMLFNSACRKRKSAIRPANTPP